MYWNRALVLFVVVATLAAIFAFARPAPAAKGKVILFLSTDCPVGMKSAPDIKKLMDEFQPKGFTFSACFSNEMETKALVDQYLADYGLRLEYCIDVGGELARKEGVTHVPTAVVKDAKGKKIYQGSILDNRDPSRAGKNYVANVLGNLYRGKPLAFAKTPTFGCILMPGKPLPQSDDVTYAKHIAPILNKRCVACHRPGEVAPISFVGYENARKWAPNIAFYTGNRTMPPWKAVPGFGEFKDDNALSEREIELLKRWANSGAKRGNQKEEPATPTFPKGDWSLGKPDLVIGPKAPYRVEASGEDEYRHFVIDPGFKETVYVQGYQVKPGNTRVVHHVIAFLDAKGRGDRMALANKDGKEGYATSGGGLGFNPDGSLGGWAPGSRPGFTPDGTAFELKPGTKIVLQIHYHKSGKVESDQTKIGLYFSRKPPERLMNIAWLANPFFKIPAGESSFKATFDFPIPADVTAYGAMPHMHLLGKQMKAELVRPDGSREPMIWIKNWDFNWQMTYMFQNPMKVPMGSKIHLEAVFDNSAQNPFQPHKPPKDIRWGEETTDEMMLLVVPFTVDSVQAKDVRIGFGGG
ncbi:MAG: redoxin domain-containing protein [Armatimonadetes bacterium]|nr:redoxin domain-containing protein [Armatimonadota bacterium]